MYRVSEQQDRFVSYLLEDGENSVRILSKRGGIPISFVCGGEELLYVNPETVEDLSREVRGGIPILFPACGRLKEGPYGAVKKHGFAREALWECRGQSTADSACVTLGISDTQETRKTFPHAFDLEHTYTLKGNTLTVRQTVTNTGDGPMPFSLGLHPYFKIDPTIATATVPSHTYEGLDGKGEFDGTFQFKNDYDSVCSNLFGSEAVMNTGLGRTVRIIASGNYNYFVVWCPQDAEFACIEPWTAPPNALNSGVDLITLKAGERAEFEMKIVVE
ncbi:MAG: hypothetical protein IJC88_01520 [Oscillospiraceae bacterium]|nr:hypothetical protein [Oscillospiraceae bacterium]